MVVVDGLNGIDACYHFAGVVGIKPNGITLRNILVMANGRMKQSRIEAVQLAGLVWGIGSIDIDKFIHFGIAEQTGAGGPVRLSQEMEAKVAEEVAKLRMSDPTLPKPRGTV